MFIAEIKWTFNTCVIHSRHRNNNINIKNTTAFSPLRIHSPITMIACLYRLKKIIYTIAVTTNKSSSQAMIMTNIGLVGVKKNEAICKGRRRIRPLVTYTHL